MKIKDNRTRKESEKGGSHAESDVIITERDAENGHTANSNTDVGNEERVDRWKVGDVSGNETANSVGDTYNGQEEGSRFFVDILRKKVIRVSKMEFDRNINLDFTFVVAASMM